MNDSALLQRFVEDRDSLSDDELAELLEQLEQSPASAVALKSQMMIAELLSQKLALDRGDFRVQVAQRIRDHLQGEEELTERAVDLRHLAQQQLDETNDRMRRRRQLWAWAGVAALLLFGVVGYAGYVVSPQWRSIARIESLHGDALLIRGDETIPLKSPRRLYAGDQLKTPANGSLEIAYADGVLVRLNASTAAQFQRGAAFDQKVVLLKRGNLSASVTPQSHPMRLETSMAVAIIRGTEFFLSTDREVTRLDVHEGEVEFVQPQTSTSVFVAANQFGVADASGVSVRPVSWPVNREGLSFVFQTNRQSRWVAPQQGRIETYSLAPRNRAQWNSDFAMRLDNGAFETPATVVANLVQTFSTGQMSLEATVTPASENYHDPAPVISLFDEEQGIAVIQRGRGLYLRIFHNRSGGQPVEAKIGLIDINRPHHVAFTVSGGKAQCYLDGKPTSVLNSSLQSSKWSEARLVFGKSYEVETPWKGAIEGVAVFHRVVSAEEIHKNAEHYLASVRSRPQASRAEVIATWNNGSHTPQSEEYAPADAALMVRGVDILKVIRNDLFDEAIRPGEQILVADWAILNNKRQPIADGVRTQKIRLTLEQMDDNPQLWGYYLSDDFKSTGPRYFVVEQEFVDVKSK